MTIFVSIQSVQIAVATPNLEVHFAYGFLTSTGAGSNGTAVALRTLSPGSEQETRQAIADVMNQIVGVSTIEAADITVI